MFTSAVIITWEFPPGPGGIGQHAFSVAHAFQKKGLRVAVITTPAYASKKEVIEFDSAQNHLTIKRISGWSVFKHVKRVWYSFIFVLAEKPRFVVVSGKSALWLSFVLRFALPRRSRLIAFLHGSEVKLPGRVSRFATYLSLRRMSRVYCVSNFTKSLLPLSIQRNVSLDVLPNGLNTDLMPVMSFQERKIVEKGYPRLLTIGQITRRKGQHRVVRALTHLKKYWPTIHYHMVGLPTLGEEITLLAHEYGVQDNISIHGRLQSREDLYHAICSADVFIMLSENQPSGDVEGFGISILEANYYGIPAIGAKGCGIEDAIEDGTNGYLVDGDNHKEIEVALGKCLGTNELKKRAREWALRHDWDLLVNKILEPDDFASNFSH